MSEIKLSLSREEILEQKRQYYIKNKTSILSKSKVRYIKNGKDNREVLSVKANTYAKARRKIDESYRTKLNSKGREYRNKNKDKWLLIFKEKGMTYCIKCGYDDCFAALDFHHNTSDKLYIPTEERILELDKCSVLCARRHKEFHWGYGEKFNI